MDLQLKGKHVLVTGGSRGIGLACAQAFVREGCIVSIIGRDPQRLAQACAKLSADGAQVGGYAAELSDDRAALQAIEQAQAAAGPIDVLVNSAGAARRTPFAELNPRAWHDAMQAKFQTYINTMDPLVKRMGARGSGAVVNIVGMGGKVPTITHIAGGAANAALMLATAGLAMAYAPLGVRINAVNPSRTLTDRLAEGLAAEALQTGMSADAVMAEARKDGMGLAMPEDIASAVIFLASPQARFISGAILSMDGASRPMVV